MTEKLIPAAAIGKNSTPARPVKDIELMVDLDPEGAGIDEHTVVFTAKMMITLRGDSAAEIIADMERHVTAELLQDAIGNACADAFAIVFGLQSLDGHTTH